VDVIAHRPARWAFEAVIETTARGEAEASSVQLIVGNVATAEGTRDLIDAAADA